MYEHGYGTMCTHLENQGFSNILYIFDVISLPQLKNDFLSRIREQGRFSNLLGLKDGQVWKLTSYCNVCII